MYDRIELLDPTNKPQPGTVTNPSCCDNATCLCRRCKAASDELERLHNAAPVHNCAQSPTPMPTNPAFAYSRTPPRYSEPARTFAVENANLSPPEPLGVVVQDYGNPQPQPEATNETTSNTDDSGTIKPPTPMRPVREDYAKLSASYN